MSDQLKPAVQNIDVKFYQCRTPGDWMARVIMSAKEQYVLGPADMRSLLANVGNLVAIESKYADVIVHGENAVFNRDKPRKMKDLKEWRRIGKESD